MRKPVYVLRGHTAGVNCLETIDSSFLASGDLNGDVKIWDLRTKRVCAESSIHKISTISLSQLSSNLVSCGRDGLLHLLNKIDLSVIHSWNPGCLQFCNAATDIRIQDEYLIVSSSGDDNYAYIYDTRCSDKQVKLCLTSKEKNGGIPMCLKFDSMAIDNGAGGGVWCGFESGLVSLFDVRRPDRFWKSCKVSDQPVLSMDFNSRSNLLTVGGAMNQLVTVNFYCGSEDDEVPFVGTVLDDIGGTASLKTSFNGKGFLLSGHWDHSIRLHQAKNMKYLGDLRFHTGTVSAVVFINQDSAASACNTFATASADSSIALWDLGQ